MSSPYTSPKPRVNEKVGDVGPQVEAAGVEEVLDKTGKGDQAGRDAGGRLLAAATTPPHQGTW